ncbi:MAG: hypothetical protein DYH17_13995 [Xanthomonadales bacterium PRO6]|nr:hypothetical protein [Xanthomonadales bacterium PRO6]
MCMTWPQLELHSHAKGDQAHAHALEHDADDQQIPDDSESPGVMHVHDASAVAWTLPSRQPQITAVPPVSWTPSLIFDSGAQAALPPPRRPPIA